MEIPFVFKIVVLVYSVIIHEIAHGYMAERLGDSTARVAGRLTLNPIPHIDIFGSILLPLLLLLTGSPIMLGWAKPVPYDPSALYKDYRRGPLKVALAGPLTNACVFLVFGLLVRFFAPVLNPALAVAFAYIAILNLSLALFNLLPIPPLDGSKLLTLFLPAHSLLVMERMGGVGIMAIFFLLFFIAPLLSDVIYFIFRLVVGG